MFLWVFDQMAKGLDENGQVLFKDDSGVEWSFIIAFGCADTEQLCFGWGLKNYNAVDVEGMCGFCLANRSTLPYTNCRANADWKATCPLSNDVARIAKSDYGWSYLIGLWNQCAPTLESIKRQRVLQLATFMCSKPEQKVILHIPSRNPITGANTFLD